mgnify:CR=1 FL=1
MAKIINTNPKSETIGPTVILLNENISGLKAYDYDDKRYCHKDKVLLADREILVIVVIRHDLEY